MDFNVQMFTIIIMVMIMFFITYNDLGKILDNKGKFVFTLVLFFITSGIMINFKGKTSNNIKSNYIQLFSLGFFTVFTSAYTIYQWSTAEKEESCGVLIPQKGGFDSTDYYVYRTIYLLTIIVLVLILQFKIDKIGFGEKLSNNKQTLHKLLFLSPILLPLLTESVNYFNNLFAEPDTNPESLLLNFIKGGGKDKKWWNDDSWIPNIRPIIPILFYILLMGLAVASSMGKIGTDNGETAVYIILIFLIFFSLIMRAIFIQDCSLDKKIKGNEDNCILEKYGGIQSMLNVSLIIIIIYHINNPIYKLLFFIIISLGSWSLSSTYMLNKK
tara:strand:- start:2146 stop:3129 length:984 start_codon:yes stop_codon:yes gene_type:complete